MEEGNDKSVTVRMAYRHAQHVSMYLTTFDETLPNFGLLPHLQSNANKIIMYYPSHTHTHTHTHTHLFTDQLAQNGHHKVDQFWANTQ